jgi:hypothetical protein
MTVSDSLMILAVLLSPLIAVQVQKAVEKWRADRIKKISIFKTLMATRGTPLSPQHVEALNMIDLEFKAEKQEEKKVLEAWKVCHDHFYDVPKNYEDPSYKAEMVTWTTQTEKNLIDLLHAMAKSLGYDFDEVQLKKGFYTPQGHAEIETEQFLIRKGMVELLLGKRNLPVKIVEQSTTGNNPIEAGTAQ